MAKKWRCTVCGYIHEGPEAPEQCPMCKVGKEKFVEVVEKEGDVYKRQAPFAVHYRSAYAFAGSFSAITQRVVPKILRLRCPAT